MMLRTAQGYFDFNDDIEVERQVKLLEALNETKGDFSYQFELAKTHNNMNLIGHPLPDRSSKRIYNNIEADIISNTGEVLYSGYLRVESIRDTIACSFFSGNSNWLSLLTGNMTELDLSAYDRDQSIAQITASWADTSGIVFPLIDTGALINRSWQTTKREDYVGCFYVKTLLKETLRQSGLKMQGELLNDPLFNKLIVATNTRSKVAVDNASVFAGKNNNQAISAGPSVGSITYNLQTNPYFVGDDVAFTGAVYTAASDMIVDIEAFFTADIGLVVSIYINGSPIPAPYGPVSISDTSGGINIKNLYIESGDTINIHYSNLLGPAGTISGGTLRITPKFIYKAFGVASVPLWTKKEFVTNVFSFFNTVIDYDPFSKTLTVNLFDKLKDKTLTDISQYVSNVSLDFIDFISNYGRNTQLVYSESNTEDITEYNISSYFEYGAGNITVDNDFIEDSATVLDSLFSAPKSYINSTFDCSLERLNFVELEDDLTAAVTSVTDDGAGNARFNIDADNFAIGDLVRIDSELQEYNGIYRVRGQSAGWIVVEDVNFDANTTGTITKLVYNLTTDDNVYLLVNVPLIDVADFSQSLTSFDLENSGKTSAAIAFFSLIYNATQINTDYTQSLSFGPIQDPAFYQRTIIENYWSAVGPILNDPVKLFCEAYLPEKVFKNLSPLTPVYLRTEETTNLYYINRISGYKSSSSPCEIELIKLSGFVLDTGSLPVGGGGDVDNILLETSDDVLVEDGDGVITLE